MLTQKLFLPNSSYTFFPRELGNLGIAQRVWALRKVPTQPPHRTLSATII